MKTRIPLTIVSIAALHLAGGCGQPVRLPPLEESALIRPASSETAAFSARLGAILSLADVERETRMVDFAALDDASALGRGWALEPTLGQAWGSGKGSSLTFHVMPVRDLEIELRCAPFHFPGSPTQRLTASVNGTEIETFRLWRPKWTYSLRIPAEVLAFGPNRLELSYSYSAVPSQVLPDSKDGRDLAVLFEYLRFGGAPANEVADPSASSDGTRIDLPFSSRISYFLELGEESSLRIGGVDLWTGGSEGTGQPEGTGPSGSSGQPESSRLEWRLRLEAAVDGSDEIVIVELGPDQVASPFEMVLPTTETGQRARIALAAYSSGRAGAGAQGLALDLAEVVSMDLELAERLALEASQTSGPSRGPVDSPNILVYMIDTLRADHLGSYGYSRPTSPNIDAFAGRATLFRRAVAQSSWTKPSVVSLITGLNPQLHGVNQRKDALAQEAVTVAETLWEAGYDTAAIFTNGNLSHMGLGQGYAHYQHLREGTTRPIHVLSDRLNDEALRWLERRDRTKPFFLYLHATDPHSPYTPPEEYLERLDLEVSDPDAGLIQNVSELRRGVVDERQREDLIALYDAEIAFNDEQFGRLVDELERRDLLGSTMIILVSDHGEEFFDHGWWQHGKTLYQEQLGVPLIIHFPSGEGAGQVVESIAQHIDILPTVLDVAGLEPLHELPGRSLRGLLRPGQTGSPANAISYLDLDGREAESVTSSLGKLVLHHYDIGRSQLLFDLASDPSESENLYRARPVLAGYLHAALKAFDLAQKQRLTPEQGEFDAELTERLKALGYLN